MNKHISILVTFVLGFSCTGKQKQASPEVDQQGMKLVVSDNVGNIPRVESDYTEIDATDMKALSYPEFIDEFIDDVHFVQLSSDELIKENVHLLNKEYLKIMNAGTDDTNPALVFYKLNPAYE